MRTPRYSRLSWDSDFLGIAVARIAPQVADEASLTRVLGELGQAGVRLAYWQPGDDARLRNIAHAAGASFVGSHVHYRRTLRDGDAGDVLIERCAATTPELEALAVAAGARSRFALDPAMPSGTAARLYELWMRASFGGAMGNEVLAARDASGLAGMVTLKHETGAGLIGLVAVAERCRGLGIGRRLVNAAGARFAALGMSRASVVTQGDNGAACRLYEACGYAPAAATLIAHFWL
jgi:dTDP-4-amino-4,6-dideoxy-D-galactose acyltransferase